MNAEHQTQPWIQDASQDSQRESFDPSEGRVSKNCGANNDCRFRIFILTSSPIQQHLLVGTERFPEDFNCDDITIGHTLYIQCVKKRSESQRQNFENEQTRGEEASGEGVGGGGVEGFVGGFKRGHTFFEAPFEVSFEAPLEAPPPPLPPPPKPSPPLPSPLSPQRH